MKRFIEIKHNDEGFATEEATEIVPVDYIEKVYKHYSGEAVGEWGIAVVWNCPCTGRRREFIERRTPNEIRLRWEEIERQLLGEENIPKRMSAYGTKEVLLDRLSALAEQ